jgi:glycosyltransferase involved in cell wall biosynthesis
MFQALAEGMVHRGHTVHVLTSRLSDTAQFEIVNGVHVHRIPVPKFGQRYFFTFFAPFFIWKYIRAADIVHTTTYNAALPAWITARMFRKPIIITVHEVWANIWRTLPGMSTISAWIYKCIEWSILSFRYSRLIAPSQYTKNELLRFNTSLPVDVVYHGITVPAMPSAFDRLQIRNEMGVGDDHFALYYFGRPGWAKGVEIAIAAVQQVHATSPHVRLILQLSKDPIARYNAIVAMIQDEHLHEFVRIIPSSDRTVLFSRVRSVDAVIVPSRSEGFGFSAAETSALGVPLIVSNSSSLPEVVSGNVNFFESGSIASCVKAITESLSGRWQVVEKKDFTWEMSILKHEHIYSQTVRTV